MWFRRTSTPALNRLDKKLGKYLNYRQGFFIEAGANDGYAQSNTWFLEKKLAWSGVLIEGIPELYQQCKKRRPAAKVLNFALVADDLQEPTVTMHYAGLMSVVDGSMKTARLQREHLSSGITLQRLGGTYAIEVPARTLESILDDIPGLPAIDFFSLDVEGYEYSVLAGLNLSRYRPNYILVEARFFAEVDGLLRKNGYKLIEKMSHHDYLYQA